MLGCAQEQVNVGDEPITSRMGYTEVGPKRASEVTRDVLEADFLPRDSFPLGVIRQESTLVNPAPERYQHISSQSAQPSSFSFVI